MLRLIKGAPSHFYKASIVLKTSSSGTFSDVSPNAVGRSNYLPADGCFGEWLPASDDLPYFIREFLTQFVNLEILKAGSPCHSRTPFLADAADNGPRTTDSRPYLSLAPFSTSSLKVTSTGRPCSPTAATIMPFDSTPRSLRGWRLVTTTTFIPTRFWG